MRETKRERRKVVKITKVPGRIGCILETQDGTRGVKDMLIPAAAYKAIRDSKTGSVFFNAEWDNMLKSWRIGSPSRVGW